jgi:hypothetical protein
MSIAVKCRCGKKFKVKDRLAGKTVRCPHCQGPLRIGGQPGDSAASTDAARNEKDRQPAPRIDAQQAILRVEKARQQRALSAEEDAAYRKEHDKLVESYDQLAGKGKNGKQKTELAGSKPRPVTIFMKLADARGVICGTLAFKYIFIVLLFCGGAVGSIFLVQAVTTYVQDEGGPPEPKERRLEKLFKQAEAAIADHRWGEAREALAEILRLEPRREVNRRYRNLKRRLDQGFAED